MPLMAGGYDLPDSARLPTPCEARGEPHITGPGVPRAEPQRDLGVWTGRGERILSASIRQDLDTKVWLTCGNAS